MNSLAKTHSLDDMPSLRKSLDKYQAERVVYEHDPTPVKRGQNIENTVINEMQLRRPSDTFCGANDIIAGVCRLDHYNQKPRNIPLSQNRVYNILQCMENINSREIKKLCGFNDRQAQYYLRAIRVIIPQLERHFEDTEDFVEDSDLGVDFDSWM